ncbi:MAG: DUF2203 domain-containing protein [Verrucomicrobiales bacterium]
MSYQFSKHYTREEARALLPQISQWLEELQNLREDIIEYDAILEPRLRQGEDLGGSEVNLWVRMLYGIQAILEQFDNLEIQVKDFERGLLDFPAIMEGREVFLCWEKGEDDIEFWHDIEAGYAGREPLDEEW